MFYFYNLLFSRFKHQIISNGIFKVSFYYLLKIIIESVDHPFVNNDEKFNIRDILIL